MKAKKEIKKVFGKYQEGGKVKKDNNISSSKDKTLVKKPLIKDNYGPINVKKVDDFYGTVNFTKFNDESDYHSYRKKIQKIAESGQRPSDMDMYVDALNHADERQKLANKIDSLNSKKSKGGKVEAKMAKGGKVSKMKKGGKC